MVTMKVVSTSCVNVLPTSSNEVVLASYIDVEEMLHMKVGLMSFVNVLPMSNNDVVRTPHIVETTSETRCI